MTDLLQMLQEQMVKEAVGLIGGLIFFGSWLLQALESRRAGAPVVSVRFFVLRSIASALLAVEGMRSGSLSVTTVMLATLLLMLYNIYLIKRRHQTDTGA